MPIQRQFPRSTGETGWPYLRYFERSGSWVGSKSAGTSASSRPKALPDAAAGFSARRLLGALGRVAGLALALGLLRLRRLAALGLLAQTHPRAAGQAHAAAAGHLLHHLARLEEPVDELVDVADGAAGSLGDAGPARPVDHLRVGPLAGRHRLDDRLDPVDLALVEVLELVAELPHAGQHPEHLGQRAHLADLLHLLEEVVEGELAVALELGGGLGGLVGVEGLLGLLDQGQQVAHVEDARGHPVGVEEVEVGELLAVGGEHHRLAGHLRDRERGAATRVTVELGQDHAVVPDPVEERLRGVDGVLADHRVDDEEHLVGVRRRRGCPRPAASALRRCRGGRRCRR